ncbi:MAG: LysE family transporter [Coriobacteriia bacterium]|nr:LysE family transporter [Coriobacteriia bacterium]MBN2839676.1 LysE family transporter [Coriobacteriia bacterium]
MNADLTAALALGVSAFLIGLTGAMSPGPYLTMTITRTVTRGPLSAALMLVGHALLEGLLLLGFAFGLQNLLATPTVHHVLSVVGGAFLVWMAVGLLRGAVDGTLSTQDVAAPERESRIGSVLQGMVVSLSTPYWSLWWATIGVKLAVDGLALGPVGVAAFFIGHQLADVTWYGFVIAATSRGRSLLTPVVYRTVIGGCALFLLYLGARFVLEGFAIL